MKFPNMWLIHNKPLKGYLPIGTSPSASRTSSSWSHVKPHEQGQSIPRLFPSIRSATGALNRYIEGVWSNEYEDGLYVCKPPGGERKPEDYQLIEVSVTESLMGKPMIFVFGSNEAGIHGAGAARTALDHYGAGAARTALDHYGAVLGKGHGHYGQSYAIPTQSPHLRTLNYEEINEYVERFIAYAKDHLEWNFKVTSIGTGLAGLDLKRIAPMFQNAPANCYFDSAWQDYLKPDQKYWGTF